MICPKCGCQNSSESKYCGRCGLALGKKKNPNGKLPVIIISICVVLALLCVGATLPQLLHTHKWEDATCEVPMTCIDCGETKGKSLGHNWESATCVNPKTCSDCGATEGDLLEHVWRDATCQTVSTCTLCGKETGGLADHNWLVATTTMPKTCSVCNITEGTALVLENQFAKYDVGDVFELGKYEQNGYWGDGSEDIKWEVLAKQDDRILVITTQAIECKQFHSEDIGITWEDCDLRQWLNDTFYYGAFTAEEREFIILTTVKAESNSTYTRVDPGRDTEDYIFLLSLSEVKYYFNNHLDRHCKATPYAIEAGAQAIKRNNNGTWWILRTPGEASDKVANVDSSGALNPAGSRVESVNGAVRPAMWIKTTS